MTNRVVFPRNFPTIILIIGDRTHVANDSATPGFYENRDASPFYVTGCGSTARKLERERYTTTYYSIAVSSITFASQSFRSNAGFLMANVHWTRPVLSCKKVGQLKTRFNTNYVVGISYPTILFFT